MKFRHCPVHFLRKVGIPTLSKSIPTLRTEYISTLFPLYNSRIVRYNSRIGGQSRNSYFVQVQFRNRTDSYFAQNIYINNPGHMTKMAAMPIYGKNPSKIFFSRTGGSISKKLGMKHRWLKYYNVYINHDPVMTLTFFYGKVNTGHQCI